MNSNPVAAAALVALVLACAPARPPAPPGREPPVTKAQTGLEVRGLVIVTAAGTEVPLELELAKTAGQRQAGLMFRKTLEDGRGMLFIFERDEVLSFWMKNTLIDLSLAFINHDGAILEIREMRAGDLSPVHSSRSARYALEVPSGWFARAGVQPGDRLDISAL